MRDLFSGQGRCSEIDKADITAEILSRDMAKSHHVWQRWYRVYAAKNPNVIDLLDSVWPFGKACIYFYMSH